LVAPRRYCARVWAVGLRGHVNTVQQPRPVATDSCQVELRPYTHDRKQWRISNALCVYVHFKNSNTCVTNIRYDRSFLQWFIYCDCRSCLRFRQTPMKFATAGVSPHPDSAWCPQAGNQCVVFSPLQPSGHFMYHQFNILQLYVQPGVFMWRIWEQTAIISLTALTDWFL